MQCLRGRKISCRAVLVVVWTLFIVATSITSVVLSSILLIETRELHDNMMGDPEKLFVDECLRDYEHLEKTDSKYQSARTKCIKELREKITFKQLPKIRLTVDELVCDPEDLCKGDDRCEDKGSPSSASFQPGVITACYRLIDNYKAEQKVGPKAEMLDRIVVECTKPDGWSDYGEAVRIRYCMWKHLEFGACTNKLRSNCPEDDSCCPVAQNDPLGVASYTNQYVCRKSPIQGLFCQHIDYLVPGANTSLSSPSYCTLETCGNFDWCRDFADIPGECLSEACQDYHHAKAFLIVCLVFVSVALVCDLADTIFLFKWRDGVKAKTLLNCVSACLKLLGWLTCLGGGIKSFSEMLSEQKCFNAEGTVLVESVKEGVVNYIVLVILSGAGSLILAPMSMQWGGRLIGLPYARVH